MVSLVHQHFDHGHITGLLIILQAVWIQLRTDRTSTGLVKHKFLTMLILKKRQQTTKALKITQHIKSEIYCKLKTPLKMMSSDAISYNFCHILVFDSLHPRRTDAGFLERGSDV